MFPGAPPFRTSPCPRGPVCQHGAELCIFGHSLSAEQTDIPPLAVYQARQRAARTRPADTPPGSSGAPQAAPTQPQDAGPKIALQAACKFPWKTRQAALDRIHAAVAAWPDAHERALALEQQIYDSASSKQVYGSLFASKIQALRKGAPLQDCAAAAPPPPIAELEGLLHSAEVLAENGYVLSLSSPPPSPFEFACASPEAGDPPQAKEAVCQRCRCAFDPASHYAAADPAPCQHHFGRKQKIGGQRVFSCCQRPVGGEPCMRAPCHVYSRAVPAAEHTAVADWPAHPSQLAIIALDAEMVYTQCGCEVARVSAVDWNLCPVLDLFVEPEAPIVDYNTRFSGITAQILHSPLPLPEHPALQQLAEPRWIVSGDRLRTTVLPMLIGAHTIMVGHSLEHDLNKLKLVGTRVLDTAVLFPHGERAGLKHSLRDLAKRHLCEFIQEGSHGHDSLQDAATCMKLVKLKLA